MKLDLKLITFERQLQFHETRNKVYFFYFTQPWKPFQPNPASALSGNA